MKTVDSNIQCPSCHESLKPQILVCKECGIKMEGPFQLNEFATLSPEDLHFLRIFIRSEGKIREMESALGLSYPTIRSRLTDLKNRLMREDLPHSEEESRKEKKKPDLSSVLSQLQAGEISFEEAFSQIKKAKE